jgi:hypothetical protein
VEDLAHHTDPLEMAAQADEMIDLIARQRVLNHAVKENARLLDRGVEGGGTGVKPALGALAAQVKVEAIDLAPGVDAQAFLGATGVFAGARDRAHERVGVGAVEREEAENGVTMRADGEPGRARDVAAGKDGQGDLDRGRAVFAA